jgi:hypothetical protein
MSVCVCVWGGGMCMNVWCVRECVWSECVVRVCLLCMWSVYVEHNLKRPACVLSIIKCFITGKFCHVCLSNVSERDTKKKRKWSAYQNNYRQLILRNCVLLLLLL